MIRLDRVLSCSTLGGVLVSLALSASGCHKKRGFIPTEKLLVTRVAVAPALAEPEPAAPAVRMLNWGDVYQERARRPDFKWAGPFRGQHEVRTGLVEVSRRAADAPRFAFEADFLEAEVPTTAWLCAKMALRSFSPGACAEQLLRTVATENTLVAYIPTWEADSPIVELVDGEVHHATVPALSYVRVVALDKRPVVLAWSHWIRGREWTGSTLVVLLLSPPLQRAGEISLTETDARDPARVTYWLSGYEIQDDGLRITGRRSVKNGQSNEEISGADVDERWVIGEGGKLTKQ